METLYFGGKERGLFPGFVPNLIAYTFSADVSSRLTDEDVIYWEVKW
jgi:hypothetical protein